jgi:SAM-dependent methyltransferase
MAKVERFEKYALRYEEWFEDNWWVYESEVRAVRALLSEGGNAVEIGVGSGRFAEPLGIKMGVEPSRKMAELAQQRGIGVVLGIAENLPVADGRFDAALMVTTLCFLDDISAAFQEVNRILKPGGCIVIGFVDKESPVGRLYQQHKDESLFYGVATFYSVDEVLGYSTQAGFSDFDFTQTIFHRLSEIKDIEPVKKGYGEGSFVVVRGMKKGG